MIEVRALVALHVDGQDYEAGSVVVLDDERAATFVRHGLAQIVTGETRAQLGRKRV